MGITTLQTGVMGGIMSGLLAFWVLKAVWQNRATQSAGLFQRLPFRAYCQFLFCHLPRGGAVSGVWPHIQTGITHLGGLVEKTGYVGTLFYGMILKCLIPLGLHHSVLPAILG